VPRRVALAVGGLAALLIAGVLVAPIVILGDGSRGKACAQTLVYEGVEFDAHRVPREPVQRIATGVGVVSGCGQPESNVNVRSLTGISTANAVGVAGDATSVYVRRGVCAGAAEPRLLACLRRPG
jgi:hypothetical protein